MKVLVVKLRQKHIKNSLLYNNKINCDDFKQIAILLNDLLIQGLPIDKAIQEYKKSKEKEFPW